LAQGYSPEAAAILGVYIHGHAGDIGLERDSLQSLLASDIIDHIGEVFMELSI
jgi:NAD(P)H-hydrate repair Nnr-like enzyme with NAD(P)H-hydrate dehydratase domain